MMKDEASREETLPLNRFIEKNITNKDALKIIENAIAVDDLDSSIVFEREELEKIRQALKTESDLVEDNKKLRKELDVAVRENAKYEERHKVWERQIYAINKNPMLLSVGASEYNDYCGDIPILKVTDLLDNRAELVEALELAEHRLGKYGEEPDSILMEKIDKALASAKGE